MIDDPYKVLGLSPGATQEEIKKAYRRMAKQYHPDLHPNDPNANAKMNEINEAYDMLTNPEKYNAKRAQQQYQQNRQAGYGSSQQYGQQGQQQGPQYGQYNRQQGYGGWSSDFNYNYEDIFGNIFGFGFSNQQQASTKPQYEPGDSSEIRRVIDSINSGNSQDAIHILTYIPSAERNARWYYLSALANHSLGNTVRAVDQMQKAVQLEPQNQTYNQLLRQFRQAGQTYEQNAQGFNMQAMDVHRLCMGLCMVQLCCGSPCGYMRCI